MNHFTYILCVAFSTAVFAFDLQLLPNVPEITLTSEANYVIRCQGNEPFAVEWTIPQKMSPDNISSIKILPTYAENNESYVSLLMLNRVSILDIGYYSCAPESKDLQVDSINSGKMYLFVRSNTHLLLETDTVEVNQDEFGDIILPCRPTSPDINMRLLKNNTPMTSKFIYNTKVGFTFLSPSMAESGNYSCEANRNGKNQSQIFTVYIKPIVVQEPKHALTIRSNDSAYISNNISLICSAEVDTKTTLKWISIPNKKRLQDGTVKVIHQNVTVISEGVKSISHELKIQKITLQDKGEYVCEVLASSGHTKRVTYSLKILNETDNTDIKLTVQDDMYNIIRKAGFNESKWIVNISPNLIQSPKWKSPNGEFVGIYNSSRVYVDKGPYNNFSTLVIRNLQVSDSGLYEMSAFSQENSKQIVVSLLVEGKPEPMSRVNNINVFYEIGKSHIVDCLVNGYPLPSVGWAFKECPNYTYCEPIYEFINLTKNMHKEHIMNATKLVSSLNITANVTGTLLCNTSNAFGSSSYESKFLVTDLSNNINGMAVYGPSIILNGDNVTIHCGVTKYNYLQNIIWKYQHLNSTSIEISISQSINHTIMANSTKYSFHSYMTIKNINDWFNGNYICSATEKKQKNTVKIEYPLMVRKPYKTVIYDSTNDTFVNLTESITLKCKIRGFPQPTITWLHKDKILQVNKNDPKISFEDNDQILHIRSVTNDDLGIYKCTAGNIRMGYVSKNIKVTLTAGVEGINTKRQDYYMIFFSFVIILFGVALFSLITLRNCLKRKRKLDEFRRGALHTFNPRLGIEEQANLLPYNESFEFPKDKIKLGILLGSGAFGVVYKAEAIGIIEKNVTSTIAVKMVKPGLDLKYVDALGSELKIMIHLGKHLNIVNLLGAHTGDLSAEELMVFVEYCRYGNIRDYMLKQRSSFVNQVTNDGRLNLNYKINSCAHNPYYEYDPSKKNSDSENDANKKDTSINIDITAIETGDDGYLLPDEPESRYQYLGDYEKEKTNVLCTHDLIRWSFQVARGMEYLASQKILHGDLATRNILLTDNNIVKICDFGFAKTMFENENYKKKSDGLLPIKWMAIESIKDNIFSTQSDIWAFGIVLWEIFSLGTIPYPGTPARDVLKKLEEGYRMEQPSYANRDIYNIMLGCWEKEPMTRPSFTDLIKYIGVLFQGDETAYYTSLNDVYVKKNTTETNSKCVLNVLNEPAYSNCKTENTTYPSLKEIKSTEDSDLKMKEL